MKSLICNYMLFPGPINLNFMRFAMKIRSAALFFHCVDTGLDLRERTCLRGLRPSKTQSTLLSYKKNLLRYQNFACCKERITKATESNLKTKLFFSGSLDVDIIS